MEKMDFSTVVFTIGVVAFFTILAVVKVFALNIDNTSLLILLFIMVSIAAFNRIEKHDVEKEGG